MTRDVAHEAPIPAPTTASQPPGTATAEVHRHQKPPITSNLIILVNVFILLISLTATGCRVHSITALLNKLLLKIEVVCLKGLAYIISIPRVISMDILF